MSGTIDTNIVPSNSDANHVLATELQRMHQMVESLQRELTATQQHVHAQTLTLEQMQQQQQHQQQPSLLRPTRPNTFSGKIGEDVNNWLSELDVYFSAVNVHDNTRTVFAMSHLREVALNWAVTSPNLAQPSNVSFDNFKLLLRGRFNPVSTATQARSDLMLLKQTGSVSSYIANFEMLMQRIPDMSDADRLNFFQHGLRSSLKMECIKAAVTNVTQAITLVQRLDSSLKSSTHRNSHDFYNSPNFSSTSSSSSSSSDQMVIDNGINNINYDDQENYGSESDQERDEEQLAAMFRTNRGQWTRNQQQLYAEGKCFYCKQKGHRSNNCPQKRNVYNNKNNNNHNNNNNFDTRSKNVYRQRRN